MREGRVRWIVKLLLWVATIVVVCVVVMWAVGTFKNGLTIGRWWEREGLKIADTRVILKDVRAIGELTCACYYEDVVMHYRREPTRRGMVFGDDEMVMIVSGKVRAGVDLGKLTDSNFAWRGDSLIITLPKAQILEIETNPSGIDFFVEKGEWTHSQTKQIQVEARHRLATNARQSGIIQRAAVLAEEKVTEILNAAGLERVSVVVSE